MDKWQQISDRTEQTILFDNGVLVSDKIELYGIWVPTVFFRIAYKVYL